MSRPGPVTVDVEGAVRAWTNAVPGLTGKGRPLANGVHLHDIRSSSDGAWATVEILSPRSVDAEGGWDSARVSYTVKARGSEAGAVAECAYAAGQLREALAGLTGDPVDVVVPSRGSIPGQTVRILVAHSVDGPTRAGDLGGEHSMRVDATFVMQRLG